MLGCRELKLVEYITEIGSAHYMHFVRLLVLYMFVFCSHYFSLLSLQNGMISYLTDARLVLP